MVPPTKLVLKASVINAIRWEKCFYIGIDWTAKCQILHKGSPHLMAFGTLVKNYACEANKAKGSLISKHPFAFLDTLFFQRV